jgi:hypothetical protein
MICRHQQLADAATSVCRLGFFDSKPSRKDCFECMRNGNNRVEKAEPTKTQMVSSLANAAIHWAKAGFELTSDEAFTNRLDICKSCEFWDFTGFANTGRCQKCGCSTQAKLRMASEKCPVGKW